MAGGAAGGGGDGSGVESSRVGAPSARSACPVPRRPEAGGYVVGHEAHQVPARRLRHVEHHHARGAVGPQACEAPLLAVHPLGLRTPARVDADALPVASPAGGGLVETAGPRDPVAGPVFDDAGLLVKDGAVMDRLALRAAGHRDLHVEMTASDHPGQQLQGIGRTGIGRRERQGGQVLLDLLAERFAGLDGLDLGRAEGAPDDQTHAAAVAHQTLDAARRKCEGAGVEVSRQPVVTLGILERGDVEELDEITVLGGVLELPSVVAEHERGPHSRRRRSRSYTSPRRAIARIRMTSWPPSTV